MKEQNIIFEYAVGGATALIYYFEPIQTQDIDIFVYLKNQKDLLVNLEPIYNFMKSNGGVVKNEYIIIHNTPVQFLIPYNPLIEESIKNANTVIFMGELLRIFTLEHLMAVMVQTSRGKDKARLEEILKAQIEFDYNKWTEILSRFDLADKWNKIKTGFDL